MTARRVAIVYDCRFPIDSGGGERVYDRMAGLFVERGCRVDYVTRGGRDPVDLRVPGMEVHGVWNGEIAGADGTRRPLAALKFAFGVFRWFLRRRREVDVAVVSALPVFNLLAVRLALIGRGTPVVADWLEVWSWRKWREYSGTAVGAVAFALQWLGLRIGDVQTVNSGFTARRMARLRPGSDPIVLGLVDVAGLEPRSIPASNPPFALFVGRHIPDKRVTALPAALAVAQRRIPALRAVVTGRGPETAAVAEAARRAAVADSFELVGRVSDGELDRLLGTAAVLVNPSRREGFGLVVVEAAAFSTPSVVVSGPDNAAVELIDEGANGFVADSVEAEALGEAIAAAVEAGPALRASTAEWYARERVEQSLDRSVDEIFGRLGDNRH